MGLVSQQCLETKFLKLSIITPNSASPIHLDHKPPHQNTTKQRWCPGVQSDKIAVGYVFKPRPQATSFTLTNDVKDRQLASCQLVVLHFFGSPRLFLRLLNLVFCWKYVFKHQADWTSQLGATLRHWAQFPVGGTGPHSLWYKRTILHTKWQSCQE